MFYIYSIAMHALGKKFRLAVSQRARLRKTIAARGKFKVAVAIRTLSIDLSVSAHACERR